MRRYCANSHLSGLSDCKKRAGNDILENVLVLLYEPQEAYNA